MPCVDLLANDGPGPCRLQNLEPSVLKCQEEQLGHFLEGVHSAVHPAVQRPALGPQGKAGHMKGTDLVLSCPAAGLGRLSHGAVERLGCGQNDKAPLSEGCA